MSTDDILVPRALAAELAEAVVSWLNRGTIAERETGERFNSAPMSELLRRLRSAAMSASGPIPGQTVGDLSTVEAAQLLHVSEREVRRRCASRRLAATKIGRGQWAIRREGVFDAEAG